MTTAGIGHVRFSLRFDTALPEIINIIVYAKFPEILKVDQNRLACEYESKKQIGGGGGVSIS